MRKNIFKVMYMISFICVNNVGAMEELSTSFEAYAQKMNEQKKPITLIVGCGHNDYHAHPDSWCVNLEKESKENPQEFKNSMRHDEVLDIRTYHTSSINKSGIKTYLPKNEYDVALEIKAYLPIREGCKGSIKDCKDHIIGYKNKFDVVVLERPLPETLNTPWTLWNAVHMLKVGGELVIDTCDGYRDALYTKEAKCTFFTFVCCQMENDYLVNQDAERLKKYGIVNGMVRISGNNYDKPIQVNYDLQSMSHYLNKWGLTNIINVKEAYQPYTKNTLDQDLKTARSTRILSAIKSQETEDRMEEWANMIQNVKSHMQISKGIIKI